MNLKLGSVLLLSLLTTLSAVVFSFVALPENSGYAGLFFITISPVFFIILIIWTLILVSIIASNKTLGKVPIIFLLTVVLQYLAIIITMSILSSDNRNYDLDTFFTDFVELFAELPVLLFTLAVAAVYTLLLRINLNKVALNKR